MIITLNFTTEKYAFQLTFVISINPGYNDLTKCCPPLTAAAPNIIPTENEPSQPIRYSNIIILYARFLLIPRIMKFV